MLLTFTIELISLAASNSVFIFCFCNLIIAVLLWSARSRSQPESPQRSPGLPNAVNRRIDHENKAHRRRMENLATDTIQQQLPARKRVYEENRIEVELEDDEDDELKRRAEEFIEKIIRSWKEEKLGNSIVPKP